MLSIERDSSQEGDRRLTHQHSLSLDHGRALVPMWDSSDPERAPPPLPLNPSSPGLVPTSRANTSSAIASAHAALTEKARENACGSSPPKRIESPERSLIKDATHKRMQSLQNTTVKERSSLLEGGNLLPAPKSPQKSEARIDSPPPSRSSTGSWPESKSPEKAASRASTPTPSSNESNMKAQRRPPPQSILGENAPPQSATMLALQNSPSVHIETPLANITNGANAFLRNPPVLPGFESLSSQIISLTTIATNLQREMNNLSRRSKDNATDLLSLKEATNARDEDIRRTLKDLITNLAKEKGRQTTPALLGARDALLLDNKPHNTSPSSMRNKAFTLPRIPSPNSFAASLDREAMASPAQVSDSSINIALLEKILRDMGTRDGQELAIARLEEIANQLSDEGDLTMKKLEEVLSAIKQHAPAESIVSRDGGNNMPRSRRFSFDESPRMELEFDKSQAGPMVPRAGPERTRHSDVGPALEGSEDVFRVIKTLKDSVAQGGGLTAQVKALVRELRGEVLGMGRELGRKLDEATKESSEADAEGKADRARLEKITVDGLEEIKEHLEDAIKNHSRQTAAAIVSHNAVDGQEVYNATKSAVNELLNAQQARHPSLKKDDIVEAVKVAWENYKPDIELQHFGLEREELLECLQQGMREYSAQHTPKYPTGATRDEVFTAVLEGLKHFTPPRIEQEPSMSRDDIQNAVRECLEEFEFPAAPPIPPGEIEIPHEALVEAVKDGLSGFEFSMPVPEPAESSRDLVVPSLTRDDVFDVVTGVLQAHSAAKDAGSEQPASLSREDVFDVVSAVMQAQSESKESDTSSASITREDVYEVVSAVMQAQAESKVPEPNGSEGLSRDDVYDVVSAVLQAHSDAKDSERDGPVITREEIIDAITTGLGSQTESRELVHESSAGVTRDDIFDVVSAVLRAHTEAKDPEQSPDGITRDDVFDVVTAVLQAHSESKESDSSGLTREDVFDVVRNVLETHSDLKSSEDGVAGSLTRDDVYDVVRGALDAHAENRSEETDQALVMSAGGISKEDIYDVMRAVLESHSESKGESSGNSLSRDDVFDVVRAVLEAHHESREADSNHEGGLTREDVFDVVRAVLEAHSEAKEEESSRSLVERGLTRDDVFEVVRGVLETHTPAPAPNDLNSEQIMERLDDVVENIKREFDAVSSEAKQNVAAHGRDTEQVLDATKDGFEKLRADIETYVDRAADLSTRDDTLDSIKKEFERLHESMATSIVPANHNNDKEEILAALREGIDSIREDMDRPRDGSESVLSGTSEILDALYDGLNNLKADVEKMSSKPVDMTVNYEILDTLKSGLESIRQEIDHLKEHNDDMRAVVAPVTENAVVPADSLKRNDIEHLESLIHQVHIKVESMDVPPPTPEPAEPSISKEDLGGIEELIRGLQESMAELAERQREPPEPTSHEEFPIKKEDFEAIETLLYNTKAKIDEIDPEQSAKKEHLDALELLIRETRDALTDVKIQTEEVSRKEDLSAVETLVKELLVTVNEVKESTTRDEDEDDDKVTKTDVGAVEALCHEIKTHIDTMAATDLASLSSKEDLKNLEEVIKEFKERMDSQVVATSGALDERQAEIVGVSERITELRAAMDDFRDSVREKLDDGSTNFESLGKLIQEATEKLDKNESVGADVKELLELVNSEFEKSNAGIVGAKLETDEKFEQTWSKFDEKLESRFTELMTKYDDAQLAAEAKNDATEKRELEMEGAVLTSKTLSEELKLLIDTLGSTLTESVEKMDEASKTVFHRVDETFTKMEALENNSKAGHESTRDQIDKSLTAIDEIRGHVTESNPKLLDTMKDILDIVGQHFEHSKSSTDTIHDKISGIPASIPPLLPEPVPEKDDSPIHEKLDKLAAQMEDAGKSAEQLEMLEKIQLQMAQTAAEVSSFVTTQTRLIKDVEEDKERAAAEAAVALEKRIAERDLVEAEIVGLRDEEVALRESIAQLKAEKEQAIADMKAEKEQIAAEMKAEKAEIAAEMRAEREQMAAEFKAEREGLLSALRAEEEQSTRQRMRLSADVSSLETALHIRREELHAMDSRAEALERRILDGVIDHSRAMLMSKTARGKDAMNLKRVVSPSISVTGSNRSSIRTRSSLGPQTTIGMAMARGPGLRPAQQSPNTARRILSLSQITHNVPNGGAASSFNRSNSVRTPATSGLRKSSWGGSTNAARQRDYGELNKENLELSLREAEEESDHNDIDRDNVDDVSDTETLRRTSLGTTIMTGSESYDDETEYSTEAGSELSMSYSAEAGSELSMTYSESDSGVHGGDEDEGHHMVLYQAASDVASDVAEVA